MGIMRIRKERIGQYAQRVLNIYKGEVKAYLACLDGYTTVNQSKYCIVQVKQNVSYL